MSNNLVPSQESGTLVTPVETEGPRIAVQVSYFESPIDVQQLRSELPPGQVLQADPLLLRLQGQILSDLIQHAQSRRLELVVIALIVLEVLIALFEFFVHR